MNACDCGYESVFCRNVYEAHNIIMAVVTDKLEDIRIMEVQLLENIYKEISEETITIYGQDGGNCGEDLYQFSVNDTLILAIYESEYNDSIYWHLEGLCGLHFLRYENGMVKGQITDSITSQPIQSFRDNLFNCLDMVISVDDVEQSAIEYRLFPNPVIDVFQIIAEQSIIYSYEIYSSNGQKILSKNTGQTSEKVDIDSSGLGNGIYYIKVITSEGILTQKFFKAV
jgi:hypothetical protein